MATVEITLDRDQLQELCQSDRPLARLLEWICNEVLEAEITDHLEADRHDRTEDRPGCRNGHYERCLTTRVGQLRLRVPRDRDGTFSTELFERSQRSEKALVLALMEMVVNGDSTRKVKKITTELCGGEFSRSTASDLAKGLAKQVTA